MAWSALPARVVKVESRNEMERERPGKNGHQHDIVINTNTTKIFYLDFTILSWIYLKATADLYPQNLLGYFPVKF